MNKNKYNKESIKARMYNRIATLWDVRNVDDLDPVVKLLVEALASEVFNLSGELYSIEDRIVEKLARAFTPSFMMAASPAHAVLHARAISGEVLLNQDIEFIYKEPNFIQKHNLRKLSMTPVCYAMIFDSDVVSFIADNRFYHVTPRGGRDHVATAIKSTPVFNNTLWVGVELGIDVQNLRDMVFYFEYPFMDNCEEYLHLLEYSRWSCDGKNIVTENRLVARENDKERNVFELYDQKRYLQNEIKAKYDRHFVTIKEDVIVKDLKKTNIPEELRELFGEDFVQRLRDDIVWLKIVLPPAFDGIGLSGLAIHANCFPVANIYCKQALEHVTPLSSIVRLENAGAESFLFMDSVRDGANHEYKQVRSHEDENEVNTYVVRRGGSERFSALDAKDFLERLLDLYRDESIAFSSIDKDISGTAEGLMENLSDFDRKLKSYDGNTEHTSYIILGGEIKERISLTVRYNITNGIVANDIKVSELLAVSEVSDISPSSIILMTTTRGGRTAPPESSQKDIYQYMLTSRDRVYTREDIKLFCRSHYGEHFVSVDVENGYEVSNKPKTGIIRTTNVILHGLKEKSGVDPGLVAGEILAGLQQRSVDGVNYRIVLK